MNAPDGAQVDHRNNDGLDNRRSNLRVASHAQNHQNMKATRTNKHSFKGVYYREGRGFCAQCVCQSKKHTRSGFATAELAARAYDELAEQLHGEFAYLNFPAF